MSDVIVHQLPIFEYHGYPPSYEYPLPARGMPQEHRDVLGSWVRQFMGLQEAKRHTLLEARWASELNGPLAPILLWYLGYEPASLVVHGDRAWLSCRRAETNTEESAFFLLPEPPEVEVMRRRLNEAGFHDDLLLRLVVALGGLREDFPPTSGDFMSDHDDFSTDERGSLRLLNESWHAEEIEGYREWENSLFLYAARNGDSLLLHPTGKVGWWVAPERRINLYAAGLVDFIDKYACYERETWVKEEDEPKFYLWPFDSYGP